MITSIKRVYLCIKKNFIISFKDIQNGNSSEKRIILHKRSLNGFLMNPKKLTLTLDEEEYTYD